MSGLTMIDSTAAARISPYWSTSSKPRATPVCPTMNENSPIWLRPAATTIMVRADDGSARPSSSVMSDLPITTRSVRMMTLSKLATTTAGLTSMPTDTKNSTEKKSRKGIASALT